MFKETKHFYDFEDFRLDLAEKVLLRNGQPIPVTPKVFETLQLLLENAGHLVEKDELMQKIWQDQFVEETNLSFNIKMLRKALGDNAQNPRFVKTVPTRGYRFIAEVEEIFGDQAESKPGVPLPAAFQTSETTLPRFKRFLAPITAFCVLFIGTIFIGYWYMPRQSIEADAPVLSAPFASEKLSTNGKSFHAVVSPDGKNVVYTNTSGVKQSVWLRQLESENNVEIIPPSEDIYFGLALSPGSDFLYFSRRPRKFDGQADIYRVSVFGGVPTKIVGEAQGWISVSPDGKKISFVRCYYREDENCSLWIADAADGKNEKKLVSRPRPVRIGDNKFAPDGKTVAFAAGQSENAANEFGLVEVDIESGAERELTAEKFFNIKNLAWLPTQGSVLLTAKKISDKSSRIWQISTNSGEALPLTKDSEEYSSLSLDKNANVIVSTQIKPDFRLILYQTENSSEGRVLADAGVVSFAPNGKIIVSSQMSGNYEIWSINADGSEQRQLTNNATEDTSPVASPDNDSIFFGSNRSGEMHIWRMNADGSNQTQITKKDGGKPIFVSPDGRWLFYHHGRHRTLWRVLTAGGDEQIALNKDKYLFALSRDGFQVAFSEKQDEEKFIMIVSLADGRTIKTFRVADGSAKVVGLDWSADGKSLAYILADSEYENNILYLQTLAAKTPRQIADLGDDWISSFSLAPDGKNFAVTQGGWKHDAVLLKGLK